RGHLSAGGGLSVLRSPFAAVALAAAALDAGRRPVSGALGAAGLGGQPPRRGHRRRRRRLDGLARLRTVPAGASAACDRRGAAPRTNPPVAADHQALSTAPGPRFLDVPGYGPAASRPGLRPDRRSAVRRPAAGLPGLSADRPGPARKHTGAGGGAAA